MSASLCPTTRIYLYFQAVSQTPGTGGHHDTSVVGWRPQCPAAPQTRSVSSECSGRLVVLLASGSEHWADTRSTSSDHLWHLWGHPPCGHVCHSWQHQTACVHLSACGPLGMEGRHLLFSLGKPKYVSISTDATHWRSPAPHSTGQLPCHPDCPSLADLVLVSTTAVSGHRSPKMPSNKGVCRPRANPQIKYGPKHGPKCHQWYHADVTNVFTLVQLWPHQ